MAKKLSAREKAAKKAGVKVSYKLSASQQASQKKVAPKPIYRAPAPKRSVSSSPGKTAIASMADGTTLYSDGSKGSAFASNVGETAGIVRARANAQQSGVLPKSPVKKSSSSSKSSNRKSSSSSSRSRASQATRSILGINTANAADASFEDQDVLAGNKPRGNRSRAAGLLGDTVGVIGNAALDVLPGGASIAGFLRRGANLALGGENPDLGITERDLGVTEALGLERSLKPGANLFIDNNQPFSPAPQGPSSQDQSPQASFEREGVPASFVNDNPAGVGQNQRKNDFDPSFMEGGEGDARPGTPPPPSPFGSSPFVPDQTPLQPVGGTMGNRSGRGSGLFGTGKGVGGPATEDEYIRELRRSLRGYGQQEKSIREQFEDLIKALDPTYDEYEREGKTELERALWNNNTQLASVMNANNTGDSEQRAQLMAGQQRDNQSLLGDFLRKLMLQKNEDVTNYKTKSVDAVNNIRSQRASAEERIAQAIQQYRDNQWERDYRMSQDAARGQRSGASASSKSLEKLLRAAAAMPSGGREWAQRMAPTFGVNPSAIGSMTPDNWESYYNSDFGQPQKVNYQPTGDYQRDPDDGRLKQTYLDPYGNIGFLE